MKLTKSQRVKAIERISAHTEQDEWTSIDLVLKEFELPTSDAGFGGKKAYVIEMLSGATDIQLGELCVHFGIPVEGVDLDAAIEADPPYWAEGKLRVFISHLTTHRELAANLQMALNNYGMSSFVAHNDIHPTVEWQIEIERALSTCDLLVALIHPDFVASKWCDQEIGYALGRGIPVFTVRCGADPHGFVSRFQAFNGNGLDPRAIALLLFDAAVDHKKLQDKMATVLVDLFVRSGSFAAARSRIGYLERLKVWHPNFSKRIAEAVEINDQVSGSWGVADQVKKLIAKQK